MLRRLLQLRSLLSQDPSKPGFLFRIKSYPILLACLSSGLIYRTYVALPQGHLFGKPTVKSDICNKPLDNLVLYSSDTEQSSKSNLRADRLLELKDIIESELPKIFEYGYFSLPERLLDAKTTVSIQFSNGKMCSSRSPTGNRMALAATRAYFWARSHYRRLDLVNILADTDRWQLEVNFRVVLLPTPSLRDTRLPTEELFQKLERRAIWHDYRAIFSLSEKGEISQVHITKLLPPNKPGDGVRSLRQMSILNRLAPSMPGARRLPTPSQCLVRSWTQKDAGSTDYLGEKEFFFHVCGDQLFSASDDQGTASPSCLLVSPTDPISGETIRLLSDFDALVACLSASELQPPRPLSSSTAWSLSRIPEAFSCLKGTVDTGGATDRSLSVASDSIVSPRPYLLSPRKDQFAWSRPPASYQNHSSTLSRTVSDSVRSGCSAAVNTADLYLHWLWPAQPCPTRIYSHLQAPRGDRL